jgi:hypothetical protein
LAPNSRTKVLVDKVVKSNVEASRAQDTPGARAFGAEGDTEDGIPFSIMVLIETRGRGTIVDGEVGVGLGPVGSDTVEDGLAMKLVKTLDGVLGVNSVALGNQGAGELGHDLGSATIPKAILADSDLLLDP